MAIINSIRKFLNLDRSTLSFTDELTDSVGLYMNERKELMKEPGWDCLIIHTAKENQDVSLPDFHPIDIAHSSTDLHFGHS